MIYINKNSALETLQGLVEQSFNQTQSYMPDDFSEKQQMAVDLFKQRIFLEEVIEETTKFNRDLNWDKEDKNINLAVTAEELIEVYKLRSDVYTDIGYKNEIPDVIEGLNFDIFDKNASIIYIKKDDRVTGSCRIVFDSVNNLPSEKNLSFGKCRKNFSKVSELSRLIIKHNEGGLSKEFKLLTRASYNIWKYNDLDIILSSIKKDHFKLYKKFGGFNIEGEITNYGNIDVEALILSWNPSKISPFFKRAFLNTKQ